MRCCICDKRLKRIYPRQRSGTTLINRNKSRKKGLIFCLNCWRSIRKLVIEER